jgi:molybdenum cofactor biosynthesis enzyme MoaA
MCHFNGPNATRLQGTLTVEEVRNFVSSVPPGPLWFASTGDFLLDPNALEHLRTAAAYGHQPCVLTNGQLLTPEMMDRMLEIGVREITISVDAIEPGSYRRIRRGGELNKILEVCSYLRSKKGAYPDLIVTIAMLFKNTVPRQENSAFLDWLQGSRSFQPNTTTPSNSHGPYGLASAWLPPSCVSDAERPDDPRCAITVYQAIAI